LIQVQSLNEGIILLLRVNSAWRGGCWRLLCRSRPCARTLPSPRVWGKRSNSMPKALS